MTFSTTSRIFCVLTASLLCGCATTTYHSNATTQNVAAQNIAGITFNPACFKAQNWKEVKSGSRLIFACPTEKGDTCSFATTIAQLHFAAANKTCATNKFTYDHGKIAPQAQCAEAYFNESKNGSPTDCLHTAK